MYIAGYQRIETTDGIINNAVCEDLKDYFGNGFLLMIWNRYVSKNKDC